MNKKLLLGIVFILSLFMITSVSAINLEAGTRMFIVGSNGDDVNEYHCTTAFDVSTCSYDSVFSVSAQDTTPSGIAFNTVGTKMFIVGSAGKDINEYHCSISFNVSTCSYDSVFDVSAHISDLRGIAFNTDGTKIFIVDGDTDDVNEYHCSTGFDISTCSYDSVFSVSAQDAGPINIAFNTEGTKMFILGSGDIDVNEYHCSTGFDISTCSYDSVFSVSAQETGLMGIAFNTLGTKMFIVGTTGDDVNEYHCTTAFDVSTCSYDSVFSVSAQETVPRDVFFNYEIISTLPTPQISGNAITINDTLYYNGIINISSEYSNFENITCEYTLNNGTDWLTADNNSTHCYKNNLEPTGNLTIQFRAQEDGIGDYIESTTIQAVYVSSLDRSYLFSQGITNSVLTLTIQDALNSTLLSGVTGTISNGDTSIEINSSNQQINLLTELNYTINIGASHYATFNLENYYMQNSTQSYTARLYPNPSIIDIQIKDGSTGNLITQSVNVQVISDTIIKSVTSTNGTAYFDDLSPNYYTLRFISANYTTSDYQQLVTFDYYHNIVVYLFPDATSLVTFTTRNEITGIPIEDVIYTISTSVNDTLVSIGSKFTDLSGQVTFSYEEDRIYYFSVSKSGFESKSFQLGPVLNANYNVWLNQIAQYNLTEALLGINLDYYINSYLSGNGITLLSGRFEENTNNTFKMVIASPNGELISYGYNLTYESTTISGSDTNSYGSTLTGTLEIGDADILDKVTLTYYYTSGVTGYHIFTEEFYIGQVPNAGLISNLKNEHYGLGMLERVLIVIVVAGIFGGLIGLFSGLLAGGVSIMFIFGYFLYSGFIEVYFVALPIFLLFMFLIRGGDT